MGERVGEYRDAGGVDVNDPRDALILRLANLLHSRLTRAGHLAQVVTWEHRGVCPPKSCAPSCREAQATLRDALAHLESVLGDEVRQMTSADVAG